MKTPTPLSPEQLDARRRRARRTALWVAAIAVLVYVGFIALMGLAK